MPPTTLIIIIIITILIITIIIIIIIIVLHLHHLKTAIRLYHNVPRRGNASLWFHIFPTLPSSIDGIF